LYCNAIELLFCLFSWARSSDAANNGGAEDTASFLACRLSPLPHTSSFETSQHLPHPSDTNRQAFVFILLSFGHYCARILFRPILFVTQKILAFNPVLHSRTWLSASKFSASLTVCS